MSTGIRPGEDSSLSTPARRRLVGALAVLATALIGTVATASPSASAAPTRSSSPATTLRPAVVAASTDVPNVHRGQYRWLGNAASPSTWTASDIYYRDQVYWGRMEQTQGVYDFRWIEDGLARAGAVKGKFGFRVMAYCPGCWMNTRAGFPKVTPDFLPLQPGTDIPAWNDERFLSAYEALIAELGRRYASDPRLGYVDVGGYGNYGEWWTAVGTDKITEANGLRLVAAVTRAFPTKHVLFNTMQTVDFTLKALEANPRLGLRTDSLGARNMNSMLAVDSRLQSYWRTRPFFTEWATNGEPVLGRDQVKQFHVSTLSSANLRLTYDQMTTDQRAAYEDALTVAGYRYAVSSLSTPAVRSGAVSRISLSVANRGTAPTYDPWNLSLVVRSTAGAVVATLPFSADLRTALPGTTTLTRDVAIPALAAGTYSLSLAVTDPSGYLDPMKLANGTRLQDGSYQLGRVKVLPSAKSSSRLIAR